MATQTKQYMSAEEVTKAFNDFGFEPTQQDIAYWSRKSVESLDDMVEKLNARYEKLQESKAVNSPVLAEDLTDLIIDDDIALIKFDSDPDGAGEADARTVWLLDSKNNTLTPFVSELAFNNYFADSGLTIQDAANQKLIYTAPTSLLSNGLALSSYKMLKNNQGVQNDGSVPQDYLIDENKISTRYGEQANQETFKQAYQAVDNFFGYIKNDPSSGISQELLNDIMSDPTKTALYVGAFAYGGYSPTDIYKDIKRQQLVKDGNTSLDKIKVIDEAVKASTYYNTPQGRTVKTNPLLSVPQEIGDVDMSLLDFPLFNMPDEAFEVLVKPLDWTSPEAKAEAANIQASYYDIIMKSLDASTEQEKAVADYNYDKFRENIEKAYGIKLSDNALSAWSQLEGLTSQNVGRGLLNTGIYEEAKDKYLQSVRRSDQQLRDAKLDEEESKELSYLMKSGTPSQIQTFLEGIDDADKKAKISAMFKPDEETLNYFNIENLKSRFPEEDPDTLKQYSEMFVDPSGNFRSNLYQQLYENKFKTSEDKKDYQQGQLIARKSLEEEDAYKEFTKATDPYSKTTGGNIGDDQTQQVPATPSTPDTTVTNPWSGIPSSISSKWTSKDIASAERKKYDLNPSGYKYNASQQVPTNINKNVSDVAKQLSNQYKEGMAYKSPTSPETFLYKNGKLNYIKDEDTYKNIFGNNWGNIGTIDKGQKVNYGTTIDKTNWQQYK